MNPVNKRIYTLSLLIALVMGTACTHDLPEPYTPTSTPAPTVPTTTVTNLADSVCYDQQIQPLLSSNCARSGCHSDTSASAGIVLNSYQSLKKTVSGNLLLKVIQDTGVFKMPPGNDTLTPSQIALIKKWVGEGMKAGIDCQEVCDTTTVTFSKTVWPLLQTNCTGCHRSDVPVFSNYSEVKALVTNGQLLCAIQHKNGCSAMPKGFDGNGKQLKLSDCNIRKIARWIYLGAAND